MDCQTIFSRETHSSDTESSVMESEEHKDFEEFLEWIKETLPHLDKTVEEMKENGID